MITFQELKALVRRHKFDFNACALQLNDPTFAYTDEVTATPTIITSDKIRLAFAAKEGLSHWNLRTKTSQTDDICKGSSMNRNEDVTKIKSHTNKLSTPIAVPTAENTDRRNCNEMNTENCFSEKDHRIRRDRAFQRAFIAIGNITNENIDPATNHFVDQCKSRCKKHRDEEIRQNAAKKEEHDTFVINQQIPSTHTSNLEKQLKSRFSENSDDWKGLNPISHLDIELENRMDSNSLYNNGTIQNSEHPRPQDTSSPSRGIVQTFSQQDIMMDPETIIAIDRILDEIEAGTDVDADVEHGNNTFELSGELKKESTCLNQRKVCVNDEIKLFDGNEEVIVNVVQGSNVQKTQEKKQHAWKEMDTMSWVFQYLNNEENNILSQLPAELEPNRFDENITITRTGDGNIFHSYNDSNISERCEKNRKKENQEEIKPQSEKNASQAII